MFAPTIAILFIHALSLVTASPAHPRHHKRQGWGNFNPQSDDHIVVIPNEELVVVTKYVDPGSTQTAGAAQSSGDPFGGQYRQFGNYQFDGSKKVVVKKPVDSVVDTEDTVDNPPANASPSGNDLPSSTGGTTPEQTGTKQSGGNGNTGSPGGSCSGLGGAPSPNADYSVVATWYTNYHRCNHSDTNMVQWDAATATAAQNCANECLPAKSPHCPAVQNMAGTGSITGSIQMWYYGGGEYGTLFDSNDQPTAQVNDLTHIGNMIGKGATLFGCGKATCSDGERTFCNYAGSSGEKGIGDPLGEPTITSQDGTVPEGTTLEKA